MRKLICLLLLSVSLVAFDASADERGRGSWRIAAAEQLVPSQPSPAQLPSRAARLDNRQAASQVKQRYGSHKILAISMVEGPGPVTYRVKTLSSEGVVKYVYVDGNSGAVFE